MNIAIIPARGGSKRIPRKNIRDFCGKPLIAYSIAAARKCALFDHIIVSTDDEQIRDIAQAFGAETPFVRPAELANDHATTVPVIKQAVEWVQANIGKVDNVEEGIEELIQKKPDLLFLDIQLHDQSGFDILESIQQPELLVIMITAHSNYATQAVRAKVNDYLLKPLSIKEFTQAVNRIRGEYTKQQSTRTSPDSSQTCSSKQRSQASSLPAE